MSLDRCHIRIILEVSEYLSVKHIFTGAVLLVQNLQVFLGKSHSLRSIVDLNAGQVVLKPSLKRTVSLRLEHVVRGHVSLVTL